MFKRKWNYPDVYRLSYIKDDESGSTEGRSKKIRLHKTVAWLPETSNDLDRFLADNLSSSVKYDATKNFKDVCPESAERYKEALNCFGKVVSNTIDTILKLGLSFDIWGEIIENLQKISSSQPLRVGVSGDSGQGKSSVIGALLGDMKLTKASGNGFSCTKYPISYCYDRKVQQGDCTVEIELLPLEELQQRMTLCLQDMDSKPSDLEDAEVEDIETSRRRCDTAVEFFMTIFKSYEQFKFKESTLEFFDQKRLLHLETLPPELIRWSEEVYEGLLQKSIMSRPYVIKSGEPIRTSQLWPTLEFRDGSKIMDVPWVIVRHVYISSSTPCLEYMTITDFPGVDDNNYLLSQRARKGLTECDITMICHSTDRVASSKHALKHVEDAKKEMRANNKVLMVCTKTDLNLLEATGSSSADTTEEQRQLTRLKNTVESELKNPHRDVREYQCLLFKQKWIIHRTKAIAMMTRNSKVKEALRMSSVFNGIQVCCVSSSIYTQNLDGYSIHGDLPPPVKSSGIPQLLRTLLTCVVDKLSSQLKEDVGRMSHMADAIKARVNLLVAPAPQEGLNLENNFEFTDTDCERMVADAISSSIIEPLCKAAEDNMPNFTKLAKMRNERWKSLEHPWTHQRYKAFIRHQGDYLVTDNVSSMNFVLVKPVRVALEDHFHHLKSDPMRALVPILDHIHEFLERIRTSVKDNSPNPMPEKCVQFLRLLNVIPGSIRRNTETVSNSLRQRLRNEQELMCQHTLGGHLTTRLQPVYKSAMNAVVEAKKQRKRLRLHDVLSSAFEMELCDQAKGPYGSIVSDMKQSLEEMQAEVAKEFCLMVKHRVIDPLVVQLQTLGLTAQPDQDLLNLAKEMETITSEQGILKKLEENLIRNQLSDGEKYYCKRSTANKYNPARKF